MKTNRLKPIHTREAAWPWDGANSIDAGCMYARYRVAAISCRPQKWDKAGNADRLEAFFREAAREKPALMVATEGMLEGYVIMDAVWHRERTAALLDIAEPLKGPYMTRFRKLARSLRACLCFGFAERRGRNAHNSTVFIDHEGNICGTYHKLTEGVGAHPTWNFWRPGRQIRAFDTPLGRCGMLICSDRWMPLLARTLVLDGAQFLLIPTYGSVGKQQNETVIARGRENGVPVVQANAAGNNLIVSKGEVVAYAQGVDRITVGCIDVPLMPSTATARAAEREFLKYQRRIEKAHYNATMAAIKKGVPSPDTQRSFTSEREFQRLRATHWGEN